MSQNNKYFVPQPSLHILYSSIQLYYLIMGQVVE